MPGVFLKREYRRYYPTGELTAHMLGFTDVDDKGQEGIELAWQDELAGKPGSRRVIKDRKGRIVEDVESIRAPRSGQNIALSIDSKIQYLAYRELKQAVEVNKAKAGGLWCWMHKQASFWRSSICRRITLITVREHEWLAGS